MYSIQTSARQIYLIIMQDLNVLEATFWYCISIAIVDMYISIAVVDLASDVTTWSLIKTGCKAEKSLGS